MIRLRNQSPFEHVWVALAVTYLAIFTLTIVASLLLGLWYLVTL